MLKTYYPIILIWVGFLATLTLRIVYHPSIFIYDWLMGSYAIRLVGRTIYQKYQDNQRTSIITDTIVEVIMVIISFGVIIFIFMSQETWMHKLLFLIGESYFLIYSGITFKEIIKKGRN
ncbi:hypothetical protein HPL003_08960 [Paenibacillus terrae HPL-003]|uniref:Uncharacterized protein n=1 Tax=Paenibacillus terrae (strain HPL-003) TaxID=985665 RepID=G7VZZ9_PAETH|nr:hypothetical protein HPL003_08960 [Paenibacillus terrae HPL-003]